MAKWESLRVSDVIIKIKDEQMVLPVIQRRLVWNEEKMELLFDSLLKGNSFGGIICIEEEKGGKPLFASRKFTDDGTDTQSTLTESLPQTRLLVIDGQQRLQSFYIGLTGSYNGKRLYFDLLSDFTGEDFGFDFAQSVETLPKSSKEKPEEGIQECLWYSVSDLYRRLSDTSDDAQVVEEIVSEMGIADDAKEKYIGRNIRFFYNNIFGTPTIGLSKVTINKSKDIITNRQRIVELFTRLNNGGTKLSGFELVASMLKGFDYDMERFLDEVVQRYKEIGLSQDTLIKLLFILNDTPTKEMADIKVKDADFATSNRLRIETTLGALEKFLKCANLNNYFAAEKNRSFIPLYFISYHIFHSQHSTEALKTLFDRFDTNDKDFVLMRKWIYISLLSGVFSRGCGWIPYKTGVRKIHSVMMYNKDEEFFPTAKLFRLYAEHPLYFYYKITPDVIDYLDREVVFYLIYSGQPTVRSEDIDHIHPKSILGQNGVDELKINSIANFQLLESGTNRGEKKAKEFGVWLEECVSAENRELYLKRHLIPECDPLLWKSDRFEDFIKERAQMIADKLTETLLGTTK